MSRPLAPFAESVDVRRPLHTDRARVLRVAFVSLLVAVAALLGACGGGQEILE